MIVVFVSECEKKALNKTRQILDSFAERIGRNTWKTRITLEGLKSVKLLLCKYATRQTAVACHRIVGYSSTELMWIVGNKSKFNSEGVVPTNYTAIDQLENYENTWFLLPHIKVATALAALFHDLGKASDWFQKKLSSKEKLADPLRHEWVSCVLLRHFIGNASNDEIWLKKLCEEGFSYRPDKIIENIDRPLKDLPPLATMLIWLILTHHRMLVDFKSLNEFQTSEGDKAQICSLITAKFNYMNEEEKRNQNKCLTFSKGLPITNEIWIKQVKRWAGKALELTETFKQIFNDGSFRIVLHYARLALMLGDHYYSSSLKKADWKTSPLIANTKSQQYLDEHLVGVAENALKIVHSLPDFENMKGTSNIRLLRHRSPARFNWQNKAVEIIANWRKTQSQFDAQGFFALNMASTGCGKTIANAKIMKAFSRDGDSLRYTLALGLRTLTLQTGDVYRKQIGLDSSELGILVGSQAIRDLYKIDNEKNNESTSEDNEELGSESFNEIFTADFDFDLNLSQDILKTAIKSEKHSKLLNAPVIVCTIDHLMSGTESLRGGHHILPCLRLMSSDLVIDEIDDFAGDDLIAISRLIYLSGMLGKKVMLSSATIPPDLAYGLFNAYQYGYSMFAKSRNYEARIGCAWIDEFKTLVDSLAINEKGLALSDFKDIHSKFVNDRCDKLNKAVSIRKGYIAMLPEIVAIENIDEVYFSTVKENILKLHQNNYGIDSKTEIKISCGVIRMANIAPCANLGKYLMMTDYPTDTAVKVMVYHSSQVLLMRQVQEKYLDRILNRAEAKYIDKANDLTQNPDIRLDIDKLSQNVKNLIYILVATPVEEVGRDHDFDWALIEPSSYRSIIQMAGRVKRHRAKLYAKSCENDNIAIMQYNYKGFKNKCLGKVNEKVFYRPGYEESKALELNSHNLVDILDKNLIAKGINSVPRIRDCNVDGDINSFIKLEHENMKENIGDTKLTSPVKPMGWIKGYWWLTGIPQVLTSFRKSLNSETLYLLPENEEDEDTSFKFYKKLESITFKNEKYVYNTEFKSVEQINNIKQVQSCFDSERIWFKRSYYNLLSNSEYSISHNALITAKIYGFVDVNIYNNNYNYRFEYSSVFGLVRQKEA